MSDLMLDVGQANELKLAFRRADYEASQVKSLCEGDILTQVRQVLLGNARIVPIELAPATPLAQAVRNTLTVLPYLTILERIALGAYDWKNDAITNQRFPHDVMTVGEWEYDTYHPDCSISSEDAKNGAEVDGWIVAKAEHLFAFGQAFPDVQRKFPIIALGSVCEVSSRRRVLELWGSGFRRVVNLYCWRVVWGSGCRFLRVRKVSAA